MKKYIIMGCLSVALAVAPTRQSHAVAWVVIQEVIKKVIKAIDLAIQQLQNKTIWLQNAQKELENVMSKLKLDEITGWVDKQKKLYQDYYEELQKVKSIIAYYKRVKSITEKQVKLMEGYKRAWSLFRDDDHFTVNEIRYMEKVYGGILNESIKNIDRLFIIVNSFQTQMHDAQRLELINAIDDQIEQNYSDLQAFNTQNQALSLARARDYNDIQVTKKLYGIP